MRRNKYTMYIGPAHFEASTNDYMDFWLIWQVFPDKLMNVLIYKMSRESNISDLGLDFKCFYNELTCFVTKRKVQY